MGAEYLIHNIVIGVLIFLVLFFIVRNFKERKKTRGVVARNIECLSKITEQEKHIEKLTSSNNDFQKQIVNIENKFQLTNRSKEIAGEIISHFLNGHKVDLIEFETMSDGKYRFLGLWRECAYLTNDANPDDHYLLKSGCDFLPNNINFGQFFMKRGDGLYREQEPFYRHTSK